MATEPAARPSLPIIESASAVTAPLRIVIDDLVDLILGPQLTTGTPVPRLTASRRCSRSRRINSLAFARASARRCARDFGGSIDGGRELVRES